MKKKIFIISLSFFFITTFVFSIYFSSKDNISNETNRYENITVLKDDILLSGWDTSNGTYTSREDSQLILNDLNCFVHTIKISGTFNSESETIKLYYTTEPEEIYSEEKSISAPYSINGNNIYITADIMVSSLRIDITDIPGIELNLNHIEINDRSLKISIIDIAKYCILPTSLFGLILFIIIKYKDIIPYTQTMRRFMPLLQNLISRDLKVKYRRSVLGFLWSILNPLLMALVLNIVFAKLFRFQVEYFATYYLIGSLMFNFVVECTTGSMMSVINAAPLIKKVYIPKYIFPMQKCAFAFINMLFGSVAVIVVMLIQGVPFHIHAFLFIIPMLYALVFAYGLGLILSALTVFFRDIEHLYSVWVTIWMYLTPIIYPEELLISNGLFVVMKLNPMYYYVHALRSVVMYGTVPSLNENIMCITFSIVSLICGLGLFKKVQDKFILYI